MDNRIISHAVSQALLSYIVTHNSDSLGWGTTTAAEISNKLWRLQDHKTNMLSLMKLLQWLNSVESRKLGGGMNDNINRLRNLCKLAARPGDTK